MPDITSIRGSVISSIADRIPSRPSPESFTPPYGIGSSRHAGVSPTISAPTSSSRYAVRIRPASRVSKSRLQPEPRVVHLRERLLKIHIGLHDHHGPKGLFVANLHPRLGPGQNRGRNHRARSFSARNQRAPPSTASLIQLSMRSASPGLISGPTSVASLAGSPETIFPAISTSFQMNV